jgi:hypothetical protein
MSRILYENQNVPIKRRQTLCREVFKNIPAVIYTTKHFYLLEAINEKIELFKAAGLIEHWHSQTIDEKYLKENESGRPKVLSLKHLKSLFYVLFSGCVLSLVVFIVELVFRKL